MSERVTKLEAAPHQDSTLERRVAVLESQHAGHGEQITELKTEVGKMGLQLNELFRQMVAVQEKLSSNSAVFTDKFDQILRRLDKG